LLLRLPYCFLEAVKAAQSHLETYSLDPSVTFLELEAAMALRKKAWTTYMSGVLLKCIESNPKDKVKLRSQALAAEKLLVTALGADDYLDNIPFALAATLSSIKSGQGVKN
jgi:hypothetical protein